MGQAFGGSVMVEQAWPVSWDRAVAHARATGEEPGAVVHDPRWAAHRALDRLAAAALDVHDGTLGAREALAARLSATLRVVPWLTPADAEDGRQSLESATASDHSDSPPNDPTIAPPIPSATLLHDDAISGLVAVVRAVCGNSAGTAVLRLAAAARVAEHHLPAPGGRAGLAGDLASPAAKPSAAPDAADGLDDAFWSHVLATADLQAVSPCQAKLDGINRDDLDENPPPVGTPTNTTGIQRVDVPDPCGPAPRMTLHGSGFGARQPVGTSVIVATWDTAGATSQLTYRTAQTLSWADDTIVVQLPSTVVSGFAAFANLEYVEDYNAWVTLRNHRVNVAMRARGCPGNWTVEVPLALNPPATAAAAYRAGAPVLSARLTTVAGPTRMYDPQTLYLHPGDSFDVGWVVYGADTLTLKPGFGETGAAQFLTAAGYPATGVTLSPADGLLTLTAPHGRIGATFELEADNGCGTVTTDLSVVVADPPVGPVTVTVIQSIPADPDVTVTTTGGVEVLSPATGNAIPLVAGKRTVVRIDWWPAAEQLPSPSRFTAQASVHVSGDMLPFGGVDVPVCASTSDTLPPTDPVVMESGPGFDSAAEYQQYVSNFGPQGSFYAVLPAEICTGGTIFGTTRPALTVVSATITVTTPTAGVSWTLVGGVEVTFHQRRSVTLRYRPYDPTDAKNAPTDAQCEAALRVAGSVLPVPDPPIVRLPGPAVDASDGHLVEDLEAERTAQLGAFSDDTWRDEIWFVIGWSKGVNLGQYCGAASIDGLTCAHEIGHSYGQKHLDVCGGVPCSDSISTWPDHGYVPVEGWDMWNDADVPTNPARLDIMAYTYCPGGGWMHPERWRRIFLHAGPPS